MKSAYLLDYFNFMTTRWRYKSNQKSPVYLKYLIRIPPKTNLSVLKLWLIKHMTGVKNLLMAFMNKS